MQPVISCSLGSITPVLFWALAPKGISSNAPFNLINCFYSIKLNLAEGLLFFSRKQLRYFSLQQEVHSISVEVGSFFGYLSRSAGCSANVSSFLKRRGIVVLLLPSGKFCFLANTCIGSRGRVSNSSFYLKKLYKAGQSRWLGRRPIVRGVAINSVDHPHGGRTNGGRPSVRPWGKLTKAQNKKSLLFVWFKVSIWYLFMYSSYSFLVQLDSREKALSKLSESQRTRLFFVIEEHFSTNAINSSTGSIKKVLLRKNQVSLLSVKVYRASVFITANCVGLPLSTYSGNAWKSILVKKGIVGFPLSFFVLGSCGFS
jgi:ribosomal protein S19